jgi:very-short-patch-repair endonuclease
MNKTRKRARELRHTMTDAEIILWSRHRRDQAAGRRFRRQHPIGPYIADFACILARLVVDVDGGTHGTDAELEHDRNRDACLARHGWTVMRIPNVHVYKHLNEVVESISAALPPSVALRATPPPHMGEEKEHRA